MKSYQFIGPATKGIDHAAVYPSLKTIIHAYLDAGCPAGSPAAMIPEIYASPVAAGRDICLSMIPAEQNSALRGIESRADMKDMMGRATVAGFSSIIPDLFDFWRIVAKNIDDPDIKWITYGRTKSLYGPVLPDRLHPILRVIRKA